MAIVRDVETIITIVVVVLIHLIILFRAPPCHLPHRNLQAVTIADRNRSSGRRPLGPRTVDLVIIKDLLDLIVG